MPKTFCVVGHDARQQAAARVLRRAGCGVTAADNAAAADYILLPMSQGRVSDEVARALQGAGQGTLILAGRRSPEQRANARCSGCRAAALTALPALLPGFDAVINTIPAPVLPRALLQKLPAGALIIDLASLPGGTDFAAAEELGLHAEHALALPGRCAPQTAGALIAQTVLAILEEREEQKERSEP